MFFIIREYTKVKRTDGWEEMSAEARRVVLEQSALWSVTTEWKTEAPSVAASPFDDDALPEDEPQLQFN